MDNGDKNDAKLLFLDTITQHGGSFLVKNAGKMIAVLTAMVAVIVTFADVMFTGFSGVEFTATLAVMIVAAYLIYFSLEGCGEGAGEESCEYRRAISEYEAARAQIRPDALIPLSKFLSEYAERELMERRERMLLEGGATMEDYLAFVSGGEADKSRRKLFSRVSRLRAISITPTALLSLDGEGSDGALRDPERKKRVRLFLGMIPTTVCMLFTVSVVLNVKDGMTASVMMDGIFKLTTLPIVGFRGYLAGYAHKTGPGRRWIEGKSALLLAFLAKCEASGAAKKGEND